MGEEEWTQIMIKLFTADTTLSIIYANGTAGLMCFNSNLVLIKALL